MAFSINRCVATPSQVFIFYSESAFTDPANANPARVTNVANYSIQCPPGTQINLVDGGGNPLPGARVDYDPVQLQAALTLPQAAQPLALGSLLVVRVSNVTSAAAPGGPPIGDGANNGIANVASARVNGGGGNGGAAGEAIEDLASYPVLTEEVGYPPSPVASGATPAIAPAQNTLGGTVDGTLRQLLGWKPNPGDPKGFIGALNASFDCTMVEGHTECNWVPRTYAVQTDLSGGITGAQASIYSRTRDAVDKSSPLLDGLYPLDEEAKPDDIAALKAVIRTQLTELVVELAIPGGPRVQRVNQLFGLLLGNANFWANPQPPLVVPQTDPDLLDPNGTLGNLRDEMGLSFVGQSFVNTVEDEQDVSNFRIVCDYVTSLAQSWLNNLQFFLLGAGAPAQPFFGTLLVLLSRQLSLVAEKVNEVRFTLDSVFIGPSERSTLQINFGGGSSMFLEDLFSWIENFASQEGPQLIKEGGRYAVGQPFRTTATSLTNLVGNIPDGSSGQGLLPPGFFTPRVQRSIQDLNDALAQLVALAATTSYTIQPEPPVHLVAAAPPPALPPPPQPRRRTARRRI